MNKVVSLPRIRNHSELSRPLQTKERKNSIGLHQIDELDLKKEKRFQNDEQKNDIINKNRVRPLKRINSELLKKSHQLNQPQQFREKKYGLLQNGKISKITETSAMSKVLSTERSMSSRTQKYDKQQSAIIKKELNEITSSILILKRQIKGIQGTTLQVRQQIKKIEQNTPQQNSTIQLKIEQIKKKTQNSRYDQQVLKSMKDRLKKIIINYEKRALQLREILEKEQRKIKILNQRSSIRQQSINKQKLKVKVVQQNQKTINKLTQLAIHDYQKKFKEIKSQKEINKQVSTKLIEQNEYHLEMYKKEEAKLFFQLKANMFLQNFLQLKWNKYSEVYEDVEKAEKMMKMHSLQKNEGEYDPRKIYFESFSSKSQLQSKIIGQELRLAACMKRNAELKMKWENVKFKEIDEQERLIDSKSMQIKSGKVQEKQVIQKQQRQYILEIRKTLQKSKDRAAKISRIKDWVLKLEKNLQIDHSKIVNLEDRLLQVINWTIKEHKDKKITGETTK